MQAFHNSVTKNLLSLALDFIPPPSQPHVFLSVSCHFFPQTPAPSLFASVRFWLQLIFHFNVLISLPQPRHALLKQVLDFDFLITLFLHIFLKQGRQLRLAHSGAVV